MKPHSLLAFFSDIALLHFTYCFDGIANYETMQVPILEWYGAQAFLEVVCDQECQKLCTDQERLQEYIRYYHMPVEIDLQIVIRRRELSVFFFLSKPYWY